MTNCNLLPLGDKVVVKVNQKEETTTGGIVLPDQNKTAPLSGSVLAVGHGWVDDNGNHHRLEVEPGDEIYFCKHAGTEVKHEGEKYLILIEREILAIVGSK